MPNQVVAAIKTNKLVAAATKKQRSTVSIGQSLHTHTCPWERAHQFGHCLYQMTILEK
jgi:hypothetical protein